MFGSFLLVCALNAAMPYPGPAQAAVRAKTAALQGPRPLQKQTGNATIRDYLNPGSVSPVRLSRIDQIYWTHSSWE